MRGLCFVVLSAAAACASSPAPRDVPGTSRPAEEARTSEGPPGCEDAVRAAAPRVPELADREDLADAVAACIKDDWSADTRRCVAAARDRPDLVACMMRHDEQAGAGQLRLDGIEPTLGDVNGDTYVVIKGQRFVKDGPRAVDVYFGGRKGTVVRFASDRQLIVRTPGGTAGEVVDVIVVFEPGGRLTLPGAFTYVVKTPAPVDLE